MWVDRSGTTALAEERCASCSRDTAGAQRRRLTLAVALLRAVGRCTRASATGAARLVADDGLSGGNGERVSAREKSGGWRWRALEGDSTQEGRAESCASGSGGRGRRT